MQCAIGMREHTITPVQVVGLSVPLIEALDEVDVRARRRTARLTGQQRVPLHIIHHAYYVKGRLRRKPHCTASAACAKRGPGATALLVQSWSRRQTGGRGLSKCHFCRTQDNGRAKEKGDCRVTPALQPAAGTRFRKMYVPVEYDVLHLVARCDNDAARVVTSSRRRGTESSERPSEKTEPLEMAEAITCSDNAISWMKGSVSGERLAFLAPTGVGPPCVMHGERLSYRQTVPSRPQ